MVVEKKPSDDLLFEASELDRALIDILLRLTTATRWPAINAVRHLNRAWKIRESDPEMAMFRSITAEEEAATAILQSLKSHGYRGADKLKPRDHVQKNAVIPFFDAITRVFATMQGAPPLQILLDQQQAPPQLILQVQIQHPTKGLVWAIPQPPLHFSARRSVDGGETYEVEDFGRGVDEIVAGAGAKTIIAHLRERANSRNRLLYAASSGYPQLEGNIEPALKNYQRNTFTLIRIYLMIEPYSKKQNFVQQALLSYLKAIDLFEGKIEFD
jgi:hypothetical protein